MDSVIWEIRDRSQLSLSARSQLDLSLSASLIEISGSSPTALLLLSIELSRLCTSSLIEVSLSVLPASRASSLPISRCSPDLVELFCPRCYSPSLVDLPHATFDSKPI
ncbi:hypothetical protein MRB53_014239 [Persea americana]|uniref:Uncharacterized protein n=1 Tax=Persea americana TaxID=3435 RepID=A0ACC2KA88_PERAE|nr:hypothetical protein MRB53_014239 [Persea americana]